MRPSPNTPLLRVDVLQIGKAVRVAPCGELDMSNVEALREVLVAQRVPGHHVFLDLSGLGFMDSSGIRVLLEANAAARANGHSLSITRLSAPVRRVLEITGLLDRLPIASGTPTPRGTAQSSRTSWCPS